MTKLSDGIEVDGNQVTLTGYHFALYKQVATPPYNDREHDLTTLKEMVYGGTKVSHSVWDPVYIHPMRQLDDIILVTPGYFVNPNIRPGSDLLAVRINDMGGCAFKYVQQFLIKELVDVGSGNSNIKHAYDALCAASNGADFECVLVHVPGKSMSLTKEEIESRLGHEFGVSCSDCVVRGDHWYTWNELKDKLGCSKLTIKED